MARYPRDMHGYGANPPPANWPDNARIAVQFVVNYEEGGENCVLHGDAGSEAFLSEIVGAQAWPDQRHWNMESIYEYGARAGFWRLHRLLTTKNVPVTVYGVATALQRSPSQVQAMLDANWEIASHGLKWIDYKDYSPDAEREHMLEAIRIHTAVTGQRPRGWYTGRCSANTVDLVTEEGGFDYVSDSYADDLPYWHEFGGKQQLVVPYTLDTNDMRFATPQGFNAGDQFFSYLKDSFDTLYAEGEAGSPKMMSIGLHCRLVGRPGRSCSSGPFHRLRSKPREGLACSSHRHREALGSEPPLYTGSMQFAHQRSTKTHSSIALAACSNTPTGLPSAPSRPELARSKRQRIRPSRSVGTAFRSASESERLGVLNAHPDLAGKLAQAKRLTESSTLEQASAGLDALTDNEREQFTALNMRYVETFGFPFIIAVKGRSKDEILSASRSRIANDRQTEFNTACREVEKIALLRLQDMLPN